MSDKKVYIRVKRRNQTFCLLSKSSATIKDVKAQLRVAMEQQLEEETPEFRLLRAGTPLTEDETLEDAVDDTVFHMVYQIAEDEYETVDVEMSDAQE